MPSSSKRGIPFIQKWLPQIVPRTRVLDVGCGKGSLPRRYREPGQHWTGVEIFTPYIRRCKLHLRYEQVINADARQLVFGRDTYDLVFLGDVLEHMEVDEAQDVLRRALIAAPWAIVSMPMGYYPQGTVYGNRWETHVTNNWTPELVRETFGDYEDHAWTPPVATFIFRRKPA